MSVKSDREKHVFYKFYGKIAYYAYTLIDDDQAAQDIATDSLVGLFKKLDSFSSDATIQAYLYKCARNKAITYSRHRKLVKVSHKRIAFTLDESDEREIENAEITTELMSMLYQALQKLPLIGSKVITMLYFKKMKIEQVAIALNISTNTVKSHRRRSLDTLKKIIPNYEKTYLAPRAKGQNQTDIAVCIGYIGCLLSYYSST